MAFNFDNAWAHPPVPAGPLDFEKTRWKSVRRQTLLGRPAAIDSVETGRPVVDLPKRWTYAQEEDPPSLPMLRGAQAHPALMVPELALKLLSLLSARDVATIARVCRQWLSLAEHVLWTSRDVPLSILLNKSTFLHREKHVWSLVRPCDSQAFRVRL